MSNASRKIFQQQIRNMQKAKAAPAETCPLCGKPIDEQATVTTGRGETISVKTRWGWKSIQRFGDYEGRPCGCRGTYDRKEQRWVQKTVAGQAQGDSA